MAGSGGSAAFDPCPSDAPCKILPLGDSITDGFNVPGGYRMRLFQKALEADKQITFVGGSMNGPTMVGGVTFPRAHEGHNGWTIAQIDGIVPMPALTVDAHIILLLIGTNDMYGQMPTTAADRLAPLLDQILDASPDALLAVGTITPLTVNGSANIPPYNGAIPGLVQSRAAAGKHIILVDQFTGFPNGELADGIHPNQAGYDRMGDAWYTAIADYLP
jgi:lysophospholipase L1-like esterase